MSLDPGELFEALAKANERIGLTPSQAMAWVLRFAKTEIEPLWPSEFGDLKFEITSFAYYGPAFHGQPPPLLRVTRGFKQEVIEGITLPNKEEAIALQEAVRSHTRELLEDGYTDFQYQTIKERVGRYPKGRRGFRFFMTDNISNAFEFHLARLAHQYANDIRLCVAEGCPSPLYLAVRRKQKYCSTACQSRMSTRLMRKRKRCEKQHDKRSQRGKTSKRRRKGKEKS